MTSWYHDILNSSPQGQTSGRAYCGQPPVQSLQRTPHVGRHLVTQKNKRKDFERVKKVCDTLEISPISGLQIPKAAMFSDATATNYQLWSKLHKQHYFQFRNVLVATCSSALCSKCAKLWIHILYCHHCRSSIVKQGSNNLPWLPCANPIAMSTFSSGCSPAQANFSVSVPSVKVWICSPWATRRDFCKSVVGKKSAT